MTDEKLNKSDNDIYWKLKLLKH